MAVLDAPPSTKGITFVLSLLDDILTKILCFSLYKLERLGEKCSGESYTELSAPASLPFS